MHEEMAAASSGANNALSLVEQSVYVDVYQYNDYGELISSKVGGKSTSYSYRADGLRRSKTTGGESTQHVWDGMNIAMDLDDDYNTARSYIRGVRLVLYKTGSGAEHRYMHNAHGDALRLLRRRGRPPAGLAPHRRPHRGDDRG